MQVFLNPSPINENIKHIDFNKVSTLILNEVEALDITGQKGPEQICEYFKSNYLNLKVLFHDAVTLWAYFKKEKLNWHCGKIEVDLTGEKGVTTDFTDTEAGHHYLLTEKGTEGFLCMNYINLF